MLEQNFTWEPEFAQDRSGNKRRAWIRYPAQVSAIFCHTVTEPFDETCWDEATVQDVSGHGIALVLREPLELDILLAILIEGISHLLLARVIHVNRQANGSWVAGCELARQLRDEELQVLV